MTTRTLVFTVALAAVSTEARGQDPAAPPAASTTAVAPPDSTTSGPTPAAIPTPATIPTATTPTTTVAPANSIASGSASTDIPMLDTSVPDAPAFTILGITPSQITRPRTPNEAGAALGTAIGMDGKLHAGAAIEFAPGLLLHAPDLSEYQHIFYRIIHNAQLSLGTSSSPISGATTTSGASSPTDLAIGFRLTIYDPTDPLLDRKLMDAYKQAFSGRPSPVFPTSGGAPADFDSDLQSKISKLKSDAEKKAWNATSVQIAAAYLWTSPDSSLKSMSRKGWATWLIGSEALWGWGQAIEVFRVINNTSAGIDPGTTLVAGGRLVVGGPRWGVSAEAAYNHLYAESPGTNDGWGQATAAVEMNLTSSSWLEISFGDTFDKQGQNDRFFSLANLKWAIDSKRVLLQGN